MCRWVHKNLPAVSVFYSPTKYPTTPTNDPEILKGGHLISLSEKVPETLRAQDVRPWSFLRASLEAPHSPPQTRCWKPPADSGKFLRYAFSPMTCPRWEQELCHEMEVGTQHPLRLRPPFLASPTVLEVADPPAASTAAREAEHCPIFFKAFFHTILEPPRSKFLTECLNGRQHTGGSALSQTCKTSHFIYICCWCCCHPCSE